MKIKVKSKITLCSALICLLPALALADTSTGKFTGLREAGEGDSDFVIKNNQGKEESFVIVRDKYNEYAAWENKSNLGKTVTVHWTNAGTEPYTFKLLNRIEASDVAAGITDSANSSATESSPTQSTAQDTVVPAATQKDQIQQTSAIVNPSQSKPVSAGSSLTTIVFVLITFGVIAALIYFIGVMKALGWIIFLIGAFFKAPFLQNIGRKMKGGESSDRTMTSLLARPECNGRSPEGSNCGRGLLKCPKCGNVGCNYPDDLRCSNQAFENNKCMNCGTYTSESNNWVPG